MLSCAPIHARAVMLSFLFPCDGMEWHTQSKKSRQMKKQPIYPPTLYVHDNSEVGCELEFFNSKVIGWG
jgi:hypothetical protein